MSILKCNSFFNCLLNDVESHWYVCMGGEAHWFWSSLSLEIYIWFDICAILFLSLHTEKEEKIEIEVERKGNLVIEVIACHWN